MAGDEDFVNRGERVAEIGGVERNDAEFELGSAISLQSLAQPLKAFIPSIVFVEFRFIGVDRFVHENPVGQVKAGSCSEFPKSLVQKFLF